MTEHDQTKSAPVSAVAANLLKQAAVISKRVQIKDVALVSSKLHRNPDAAVIPETLRLTSGFKVVHDFSVEEKELEVLVSFFVSGGTPESNNEDSAERFFKIETSFGLKYAVNGEEPCEESSLYAFSRVNGIYNAWPYWREYVQSTIGRMGLPPVVLPVLTAGTIESMVRAQGVENADVKSESSVSAGASPPTE